MQVEIPGPSAYDTERPFFQGSVNPMLRIFLIVPVVLVIFSGIGSAPCGANDRRIDILRRLDRDKDGRVTTEEIPPSARPIVRRIADCTAQDKGLVEAFDVTGNLETGRIIPELLDAAGYADRLKDDIPGRRGGAEAGR